MSSTSTRRWLLGLTSIASFMVALDLLVVSTALPTIRLDLQASIAQVQWTVTAYGLSFAGLLMTGAALGDRFGRRRVFMVGLALFAIASAGCGISPSVEWLIASRAVQGVGAALVMPLAVALLSAGFPASSRGRALGIFEGLTGLATIAGPPVGGIIAQLVGWEAIFWVNVPIAALLLVLARQRTTESYGPDAALDLPGLVLVTAGATALVWALVRGNEAGWVSVQVLSAAAVGATLLVGFVVRQRGAAAPMLPLSLFGSRAFSAGTAASLALFAALYGSVFFLAQFLQAGLGYSPLEAGLRLMPWTATLFVVAPLAGVVADRLGDRPVLVGGLTLNAAGLAWIAVIASPDLAYPSLVVPLLVTGIGASMAIPVVQNAVLGAVSETAIGKSAGANSMTQELGGAFGVAVLVAVFTAVGTYDSAPSFVRGFGAAMGVSAALAAVAALAALAVPGRGPDYADDTSDAGDTDAATRSRTSRGAKA